jgi:transposase
MAIDATRREEARQHKQLLKNTRYLWLKRPTNLTARQQDLLDELLQQPLEIVRAYEVSLRFDDFYEARRSRRRRGVPAPLDRRGPHQRADATDQVHTDARG